MELSFGARLRRHREQQGVALTTIADQTKIKASLLEGLERDDVSHWPAGIFRRSYVRAYAQAIGLVPDSIVSEFLSLHPDPIEEVFAAETITDDGTKGRLPTRLTYLISSAISALPSLRTSAPRQQGLSAAVPIAESDLEHGSAFVRLDLYTPPAATAVEPADVAAAPLGAPVPDPDEQLSLRLETIGGIPIPPPSRTQRNEAVPSDIPATAPPPGRHPRVNLRAVAELCTGLGRAEQAADVVPILERASTLLDAVGLILWTWDPRTSALRPVLSHGYSDDLLAHVVPVPPDSDNAIGTAFRSAETRIVNGDDVATGAVVAPLITPGGCSGVLAAEFRNSEEQLDWVCAIVTILAAQLSMLVGQPVRVTA